jgi:hypothetical protein
MAIPQKIHEVINDWVLYKLVIWSLMHATNWTSRENEVWWKMQPNEMDVD